MAYGSADCSPIVSKTIDVQFFRNAKELILKAGLVGTAQKLAMRCSTERILLFEAAVDLLEGVCYVHELGYG